MKAITAIGIGGAIGMLLLGVLMEGGNPCPHQHPGAADRRRRHGRRHDRVDQLPQRHVDAQARHQAMKGDDLDADAHDPADGQARREGPPRRPARARGRHRRARRRVHAKGLQLVVDGTDSDLVRSILESEIDGMARHPQRRTDLRGRRRLRPDARDPRHRHEPRARAREPRRARRARPLIAGAFIATLYGVGSANLIFLPISNKLKELSAEEPNYREMLLDGDPLDPGRRQPAPARGEARDATSRRPSAASEAEEAAAERRARAGGGMSARRGRREAAARGARRRRALAPDLRRHDHAADGLFIVLWSISSVNISKFKELKQSLQQAFIGKILTGGSSVLSGSPARIQGVQTASPSSAASDNSTIIPNISAPIAQATQAAVNQAAKQEQQNLRRSSSRSSATPASTASPARSAHRSTSAAS